MNTKMTLGGVGPKLALMCLPYVILSIAVMRRDPEFLTLPYLDQPALRVIGFVWLSCGLLFWVTSAIWFLREFSKGKLITGGPYALCRNPIYASLIIFVIPALGVILHSGIVLSITAVLYLGFKLSIHGESILLLRTFGDTYGQYSRRVNELFPFPRYLFAGKRQPADRDLDE